jgi:hypothetical protein
MSIDSPEGNVCKAVSTTDTSGHVSWMLQDCQSTKEAAATAAAAAAEPEHLKPHHNLAHKIFISGIGHYGKETGKGIGDEFKPRNFGHMVVTSAVGFGTGALGGIIVANAVKADLNAQLGPILKGLEAQQAAGAAQQAALRGATSHALVAHAEVTPAAATAVPGLPAIAIPSEGGGILPVALVGGTSVIGTVAVDHATGRATNVVYDSSTGVQANAGLDANGFVVPLTDKQIKQAQEQSDKLAGQRTEMASYRGTLTTDLADASGLRDEKTGLFFDDLAMRVKFFDKFDGQGDKARALAYLSDGVTQVDKLRNMYKHDHNDYAVSQLDAVKQDLQDMAKIEKKMKAPAIQLVHTETA